MKILLVDDERQLTDALSVILKQNNYSVDVAYNGEDGIDMALTGIYDLIILDVMMPRIDGFSVLKEIRKNNVSSPVLMLSAKSETEDKITGLNFGADDYLTKPFNTNELLARIKALLRRKAQFTGDIITISDLSLDRDTCKLLCNDRSISLSKKEYQIIEMLMLSKGKIIEKERIIEKIWGYDSEAEYNTVEVYISFIRKKLLAVGSNVEIKSMRGIGYSIGETND